MAIVYKEEFATKLQERLSEKTKWKDIAKVDYTDVAVLHNPYKTNAVANVGTRGTAYTSTAVATTDDTVSINTYVYTAEHIDRADLAQKSFADWMDISDDMGVSLNEKIEEQMYANHAEYTDFDNAKIGGAAGNITVSDSNVDDIIRGVKREIRIAGGENMFERNGGFIVWRPADFEKLEAYAMAQGFNTADGVLENGTNQGFKYGGFSHFSSNKLTAGHLFAGVKKALHLGICKSTYGKTTEIENPVVGGGQISGLGLESRVDFKFKAWSKMKPVLFDILVA
jgi:hypothetical protein